MENVQEIKSPIYKKGDKVVYVESIYSTGVYEVLTDPIYNEMKESYMYTLKKSGGDIYPILIIEKNLYICPEGVSDQEAVKVIELQHLQEIIDRFNNNSKNHNKYSLSEDFEKALNYSLAVGKTLIISVE